MYYIEHRQDALGQQYPEGYVAALKRKFPTLDTSGLKNVSVLERQYERMIYLNRQRAARERTADHQPEERKARKVEGGGEPGPPPRKVSGAPIDVTEGIKHPKE